MNTCDAVRSDLSSLIEGELGAARRAEVEAHLNACVDCRETAEALRMVCATVSMMNEIEPPVNLAADLSDSPCRRWLGLLFQAIDRDISDANLARLLSHLEQCRGCQRAWSDMSLIHQVSTAMEPPSGLLERCTSARNRVPRRPFFASRAATAAAYFIAVLASMLIGNPAILARNPAAVAMHRVTDTVTVEVQDVASEGRGELRVMLWRVWKWGNQQADNVRQAFASLSDDTDATAEQGDRS